MNIEKFKGVFPPVPTIVDDKGHLDEAGMATLLDHVITSGANGILVLGSGGEFCHMSHETRLAVAEFCVDYVDGRVPVLLGIAAPGTAETIGYGQHAAAVGADAVLVVNPYYAQLNSDYLYHHYRTIAESIPLPVFLYNFPALTGQDIGLEVIARLARDVPNIIGIKDTIDNISHTREVINLVHGFRPDFIIFSGYDEYMLDTLILGGHGGIPATFNFAPEVTGGIYDAFIKKDYERAFSLQRRLAKLSPLYALETPFFGVIKEAVKASGVDISTEVIAPARKLSPEKTHLVKEILHGTR
ncbi:dihydrodipicolinate synthase family protein [Acerihabitans arboris]|uniref:Dihydrodipicolinate synthase family protein n=1 Tax=Acerihabitans arboris TaxID=2691583 RepID=A0A845SGE3_9GAMM|nr:dihydrodipicolinate synthase family protein [Acerihabitans arboris]NDL62136.1 dihydrodipicolinate synthase family protein [Acerihabitans arboris]